MFKKRYPLIICTIGLVLLLIGLVTPLKVSVLELIPNNMNPYQNLTHTYQKNIDWTNQALSQIDLICPQNQKVNIYKNILNFSKNYIEGYISENKTITLFISNSVSEDHLKISLFKALGHNCTNPKVNQSQEEKISTRSLLLEDSVENIKKYGMFEVCYGENICFHEERRNNNDYSAPLWTKISLLNQFHRIPTIVSYEEIKSNLSLYIDDKDTVNELEKNPKSFTHNFNSKNSYPMYFVSVKR